MKQLIWYFIEHDGSVVCEITGHRKRGIGLEVPCIYTFSAKKMIRKLRRKLLEGKNAR